MGRQQRQLGRRRHDGAATRATDLNNIAQVQVDDHNHLATRDLPDTYGFGDEHYNFSRNVRGDHHVLATLDERTYTPGGNAMGQDHPVTWCKLYDGDNINDNTGTPKSYTDGRTWVTSMGHFGASYTANGGNNNLVKMIVGGVRWVAGEGRKSDCSGTVWSSFTRTVVVPDANNPIGIDVAKDGKVYWSEIGNPISLTSTGYVKMYDPDKPAGNKTTVISIPTRADHGNSEDGVLGMSLQPGFDLDRPDQAQHLRLLLAAQPGLAHHGQRPGRRLQPDQPLDADRRRHRRRAGLRARDPARPQGQDRRLALRLPGRPDRQRPRPRGRRRPRLRLRRQPLPRRRRRRLAERPGPQRLHADGLPRQASAGTRARRRPTRADLRGKIIRITPKQGDIPADTEPGVDATYAHPGAATCSRSARPRPVPRSTRWASASRSRSTRTRTNPGIIGMGEYCHDNGANGANRSPAGICEWNLINQAGNFGWPFCMGDNSPANTNFRWNYAEQRARRASSTTARRPTIPSDIRYAPDGQTAGRADLRRPRHAPEARVPATIWKKYPGAANGQSPADFGDLERRRHAADHRPDLPLRRGAPRSPDAFPRYYDGSWFINNRGADNGFWKEVKLRKDNNQMLRVQDWLPVQRGRRPVRRANSSLVIGIAVRPRRRAVHGALLGRLLPREHERRPTRRRS